MSDAPAWSRGPTAGSPAKRHRVVSLGNVHEPRSWPLACRPQGPTVPGDEPAPGPVPSLRDMRFLTLHGPGRYFVSSGIGALPGGGRDGIPSGTGDGGVKRGAKCCHRLDASTQIRRPQGRGDGGAGPAQPPLSLFAGFQTEISHLALVVAVMTLNMVICSALRCVTSALFVLILPSGNGNSALRVTRAGTGNAFASKCTSAVSITVQDIPAGWYIAGADKLLLRLRGRPPWRSKDQAPVRPGPV